MLAPPVRFLDVLLAAQAAALPRVTGFDVLLLLLAQPLEFFHLVLAFLPRGGFEFGFGPDFPALVVVVVGAAGGSMDGVCEATRAEEVDVVSLRADEMRAPQAHQSELHARDLALELRHHGHAVAVQVLGRVDRFRDHGLPRQDLVRVQFDLEDQGAAFELCPCEIFF